MDQLDGDSRGQRRLPVRRRRQEDEERPESLPARRERLPAGGRDDAPPADGGLEPRLQLGEIGREPWSGADRREGRHAASATWRATMPPASRRYRTSRKPARTIASASSVGPGNRRTLAGRYEYARPPGRSFPSSGTVQ